MNSTRVEARNWTALATAFAVAIILSVLAISSQSLWIDEAHTATKAWQPSLSSWWNSFAYEIGSDAQMPLYMFLIWGWEKIFGHSEFALRAFNLPWMIVALAAWLIPKRRNTTEIVFLVLTTATSCFLWQYMDEARPYIMQFAAACVVFNAAWAFLDEGEDRAASKTRFVFWLGIVFLAGSSMLGVFWAGSAIAVLLAAWSFQKQWPSVRALYWNLQAAMLLWLPLALLGAFYAWTVVAGAKGSTVATTGLASFLFAGYELCGFMGLGPSRNVLRESGVQGLKPFVPALAIFGALLVVVFASARKKLWNERKLWTGSAALTLSPILVLVVLAIAMNFRVLGRHLTPVEPLVVALLALGSAMLWQSGGFMKRSFVALFFAAAMDSSVSFRSEPRHGKEDYRTAVSAAKKEIESNKVVWWVADNEVPIYYGLSETGPQLKTHGIWFLFPTPTDLTSLPAPDVIFFSRADVFDLSGAIREYAAQRKFTPAYTINGFTVLVAPNRDGAAQ